MKKVIKEFNTLYKRALNGKTSQWTIQTCEDAIRTISGYIDGVKTTSEWYDVEATNVGRSNYRSAEDQAIFQANKTFEDRKKAGWVEDVNEIDTVKVEHFQPMLAAKWEDVKMKIEYPVLVQPKLDGIRCIAKADGLWTRNGKRILSCPHIEAALANTFEHIPDLILDGELYNHDLKEDFNTITSIVKKLKPTAEDLAKSAEMIQYWVYDVPSMNFSNQMRNNILRDCFDDYHKDIIVVESKIAVNEASVDANHEAFVEQGYEGLMVRVLGGSYENRRSKNLLKMKSFSDDEFEIVDFVEGNGRRVGCLQSFVCKAHNGELFNANMNAPESELKQLWINRETLKGKKATVKYFSISEYGIPRFPKVIQIDRDSYE